jgi:H+/Cl- antiporter ClcA
VAISTRELLAIVGGLFALELVVLVLWVGVDAPLLTLISDPNNHRALVYVCRMGHAPVWWALHLVPKGLSILVGLYLSYQIRHIHHNFNEVSRSVSVLV